MQLFFNIRKPFAIKFNLAVRVNSQGIFTCMLPEEIGEIFKEKKIKLGCNRNKKYGFFTSQTFSGLEKKIQDNIDLLCSVEEISREKIIQFDIQTTCSYWLTNKGDFAPNGYWPGVDREKEHWRGGTKQSDSQNCNPTGIVFFAKPIMKVIYKYMATGETYIEFERCLYPNITPNNQCDPGEWLFNICATSPPQRGKLKEIPYSQEAAQFFVDLYKSMFALNEKIKPFLNEKGIIELINNKQNLLDDKIRDWGKMRNAEMNIDSKGMAKKVMDKIKENDNE